MVHIKQRALRAFKQYPVARTAACIQNAPDTVHKWQHFVSNAGQFGQDHIGLHLFNTEPATQRIMMREHAVNLRWQRCHIGQIHQFNRATASLIFIGRADAATCRANLGAFSCFAFAQAIQLAMQR